MSHIRCPMCGKDSATSTFDPMRLDNDIYVRQAIPLGYKKGFTYSQDESVLGDDEYTPKITERCFELLKTLIEKKVITAQEIEKEFKIGVPIEGSDDVMSYNEVLDIVYKEKEFNRAANLQNQSDLSRLRNNSVSSSIYNDLIEKYNDLEKKIMEKQIIDKILLELHDKINSLIRYIEDEWYLYILDTDELTEEIYTYLKKELIKLNRMEIIHLEKRILTTDIEVKKIFLEFRNKPKDMTSILTLFNEINRSFLGKSN